MMIAALPSKPAVISMVLGVAILMACVGYAVPEYGVSQRRLASLEKRLEGVDRQRREAGQRRRAGGLSPERGRSEHARLAARRDSLLLALQTLADQRAHEKSDAYLLLGGGVLGLVLFGIGRRDNDNERAEERARRAVAALHAARARQVHGSPSRSSVGLGGRQTGAPHADLRRKRVDYLPAREATFDREPQDLHHALMRIRHLAGEHAAVPHDVQIRAAHAIVDSDSPEAARRSLRVSGVLHVLDRVGANTTRLTGAIPEIWHRFHPE
jgi:hypothetical protein